MKKKWYSISSYEQIVCCNCQAKHENLYDMDHHLRICPACNIECIWFDLGSKKGIQIIPSFAPLEFRKFIKWAQQELDELELINLLNSFEELNTNIRERAV